jgi:hypothetical protein
MLTTGKGSHYCKHCGFDMKAKEERMCVACDGDFCEPRKHASLKELKANHPRVVAEKRRWLQEGCRHRPECLKFSEHVQRVRT